MALHLKFYKNNPGTFIQTNITLLYFTLMDFTYTNYCAYYIITTIYICV